MTRNAYHKEIASHNHRIPLPLFPQSVKTTHLLNLVSNKLRVKFPLWRDKEDHVMSDVYVYGWMFVEGLHKIARDIPER